MSSNAVSSNAGPTIRIADHTRAVVTIGPIWVDADMHRGEDGAFECLYGPITTVTVEGTVYVREPRDCIDSLRFACLRDDVRTLTRERTGGIRFGDHAYFEVLELIASGDQVHVLFSDPSKDLFGVEVAVLSLSALDGVGDQIDSVERTFGPLTGCCGACAVPEPTYDSRRRPGGWADP